MPRMQTPHPTYNTFKDFLEGMEKETDEVRAYFWKNIQFAEKERARLSGKNKRRYQKIKDKVEKFNEIEAKVKEQLKAELRAQQEEVVKPQEIVPAKQEPPVRKMPEYIEPRNLPVIQTTKRKTTEVV